jgi:solute:Na+ symporter, SSS family
VPALVYAVGAYGFFALPYIIVHPFVFTVMPVLWRVAKTNGYVTAADVVHETIRIASSRASGRGQDCAQPDAL